MPAGGEAGLEHAVHTAAPARAGGYVYRRHAWPVRVMHWINASDGRFAARSKAGGRVSMPPVVADGLLLVSDDDGGVSAWRIRGAVAKKATPAAKPSG